MVISRVVVYCFRYSTSEVRFVEITDDLCKVRHWNYFFDLVVPLILWFKHSRFGAESKHRFFFSRYDRAPWLVHGSKMVLPSPLKIMYSLFHDTSIFTPHASFVLFLSPISISFTQLFCILTPFFCPFFRFLSLKSADPPTNSCIWKRRKEHNLNRRG